MADLQQKPPKKRQRLGLWQASLATLTLAAALAGPAALAQPAPALVSGSPADALRQRQSELAPQLQHNAFGRPLVLESSESDKQLRGNIYALVDQPFATVGNALKTPASWCEVLMLHLNTKQCLVQPSGGAASLAVSVGRKYDQPPEQAQQVQFSYAVEAATDTYLAVRLRADKGPLSTHDYRISLDAAPAAGGKTFIHLAYSYAYGTAARFAMQGYLATLGRDKVGFTATGTSADGKPTLIGGVRGVVERNTMRYYLAIDAYLASLAQPPAQQAGYRLAAWFDATEQYAQQLHEVERDDYLAMKRKELQRTHPGS
ncbi:MAG: hypothetical protein V4505_17565 [Pseudomonadota bacterium]